MNEWANSGGLAVAGTAFWLGVLTSLSPCPLASNIAAISYIGKGIGRPRRILAAGLLYTLGRVLAYAVLGGVIVASLASATALSEPLQRVMNQLVGPILVVAGMFMLELLRWNPGWSIPISGLKQGPAGWGLWGATGLGALFALSFCPVSAALFFGSLIPLAVSSSSSLMLPFLYGVGTGLPVLAFSILFGFGAQAVSRTFERVSQMEWWARRTTGVLFILIGLYYTLNYVFEVFD